MVSFVIPVLNERQTLAPLCEGIQTHAPAEREILFVDDGSTDGSYEELHRLAALHRDVRLLRMRGNLGKAAALAAGFARCKGEIIVTLDSDLQDDPKEIPRFIEAIEGGLDVVCGWKRIRRDPWHKTVPSRVYNAYTAWLFNVPLHDVNCGFRAMRREVVRDVPIYGGLHRLLPVLAAQRNYRVGEIPVEHHPRRYGKSKYGWQRFFSGAADVYLVYQCARFRHQPGHLFFWHALMLFMLAIVVAVFFEAWTPAAVFFAGGALAEGLGVAAELILYHAMRHASWNCTDEEDSE